MKKIESFMPRSQILRDTFGDAFQTACMGAIGGVGLSTLFLLNAAAARGAEKQTAEAAVIMGMIAGFSFGAAVYRINRFISGVDFYLDLKNPRSQFSILKPFGLGVLVSFLYAEGGKLVHGQAPAFDFVEGLTSGAALTGLWNSLSFSLGLADEYLCRRHIARQGLEGRKLRIACDANYFYAVGTNKDLESFDGDFDPQMMQALYLLHMAGHDIVFMKPENGVHARRDLEALIKKRAVDHVHFMEGDEGNFSLFNVVSYRKSVGVYDLYLGRDNRMCNAHFELSPKDPDIHDFIQGVLYRNGQGDMAKMLDLLMRDTQPASSPVQDAQPL